MPLFSPYLSRSVRFSLWLLLGISVVAQPAFSQYSGYWHTSGSQIFDSSGKAVRISGVNWYGFETTDGVVHGLYDQDYRTILTTIHTLGYNTVRLPFANQIVENPIIPSSISYSNSGGAINTDLKGLNSLQIIDKIVAEAGVLGLKVILDNHRSESGNSAEANGLWYTSAYPETKWIADWKTLVTRYAAAKDASGNPTVIGVDLRNEPHNATSGGSCWTGDNSAAGCPASNTTQNWPAAAERAGNAVLGVNPNLLIFVEGTDCYNGDCDFWGGNLEGAKNNPVSLATANRLVYSAHDYGPTEYQQSWFNSSTTTQSLTATWTKFWAYLSIDGTAPVWVGEFGTTNDAASAESSAAGSEGQWFSSLVNFLGNEPSINWTYWALNGEDSYGLLDSNYNATPPSSLKQQLLSSIQAKAADTPPCAAVPAQPSKLTAVAASSSTIGLTWSAVTAPANCSITYSVFRATTKTFTPSSANQIVSGITTPTYSNTGLSASTAYYYSVEAVDGKGASAASAVVGATTPAAPVCGAAPALPNGLSASATSSSAIALKWSAVATPANCSVTYSVFRATAKTFTPSSSNLIVSGLSTPSYSNTGLSPSTVYSYSVEAVDSKGASAASAIVSATTPAAPVCGAVPAIPAGLTASATAATAAALKWSAVATPANCSVTYSLFRSTISNFTPSTSNRIASGLTAAAYSDSGLTAATSYYYAIEASDTKGSSAASAKVSMTTPKAAATVACHVTYTIVSQWGTGFEATLAIQNTGATNITSWNLQFTFPDNQQLTSLWNANYTQSGEKVTLTNESYNGSLPAGSTYTGVGLTANYSGANSAPTSFSLNGTVCH